MAKSKGTKKKTKRSGAKKASRPSAMSRKPMALAMGACGISNPFCPEAIGARWPDNSFTKSNTFSYVGSKTTIGTITDGSGSSIYFAGLEYQYSVAATLSANQAGYTALQSLGSTGLNSRYRITSWGLKIQVTTSPMTTQGTLSIRLFSPMKGTSLVSLSTVTTFADSVYDIPLSRCIGHDLFIVPMPLGDDARLFKEPDTTAATMATYVNPGWQVVNVAVTGALASQVVANVYCFYNYEVIPDEGDNAYSYAKAPPPDSRVLREANAGVLERVGNFVEGTAAKVDQLFQSKALKYFAAIGGAVMGGPAAAGTAFMLTDGAQRGRVVD